MKVCDFRNTKFGMLVKHSPHWVKECNYPKTSRHKIGLVVDRKFYADATAGAVCHPVVHWEGEVMGHVCHPANVVPYRKRERDYIPWIEVAA